MSAHNKYHVIDTFTVTAVEGDSASEVVFTIVDTCNFLTSAPLIKQVLNSAVAAYAAAEDIDTTGQCQEGATCCCGYPITWTLATKSATIDFGGSYTYDALDEVEVSAPFGACG
jgi:hypothetical protein